MKHSSVPSGAEYDVITHSTLNPFGDLWRHLAAFVIFVMPWHHPCEAAEIDAIVRQASEVLQMDWAAYLEYALVERDETRKGDTVSSRTSQVVTIEGSDYYMPIAIDDRPLSPDQANLELRRLMDEIVRRRNESASARAQRLQAFKKQRDENGALILEFPKALAYTLSGEQEVNGHDAYILLGVPKKRAGPLSRAAKVLSGMTGTIWIDRSGFHTVRAECKVLNPIPVFGILARVMPGTHVELELSPVSESVWLISRYSLTLAVSRFWFKSTQVTTSTYSSFRPNSIVVAELLGRISN